MVEIKRPRPGEVVRYGRGEIRYDDDNRQVFRPDGTVLREYLRDRSRVSFIRGPIGSGTSSTSMMKMYAISMEQEPDPRDGMRRSRWFVVRNTYNELKETTIKTWLDWFKEELYGRFFWTRPYYHIIRLGDMEMDVRFFALDTLEDVRKMRSLEPTGWWFNELEYQDKEIVDEADSRLGRYPAVKDGGATWSGILGDMNSPSEEHWVPQMMGEVPLPESWTDDEKMAFKKPESWKYFIQPPAMIEEKDGGGKLSAYRINPKAENLEWLRRGYYEDMIEGKSRRWIESRVLNKITLVVEGMPVHGDFDEGVHVADQELLPVPGHAVYVGIDFGRNPAVLIGQIVNGQWRILGEAQARNASADVFAPVVKRLLSSLLGSWNDGDNLESYDVDFYGDPKGQDGTQSDERTAYDVYRKHGVTVIPAPVKNNNILTRIETVDFVINGMVSGNPRLQVCPVKARAYKVALMGAYHYARIKGTNRHKDTPEKNRASDIADAGQYMFLGAGEGREARGVSSSGQKPVKMKRARKKSRRRYA